MKISLKAVTKEIKLEDESGKELTYYISRFSAAEKEEFLDEMESVMDKTIVDGQEVRSFKSYKHSRAMLLKRCLLDSEKKPVPTETIQAWPDEAVEALYTEAQKYNKLGAGDEDPANPKP